MRMHVFAATVRLTFCLQPISFSGSGSRGLYLCYEPIHNTKSCPKNNHVLRLEHQRGTRARRILGHPS